MEGAAQHDIGFVKRKRLNIYHPSAGNKSPSPVIAAGGRTGARKIQALRPVLAS
jgi:hypothetical protein